MKDKYTELELEVIEFRTEDVIATSDRFSPNGQKGEICSEDYDVCITNA